MGLFGLSSAGKDARNGINRTTSAASGWANDSWDRSGDLYGKSNGYGDNVWASNYNAMDEGLGSPDAAHNAGERLMGDVSGDLAEQRGRWNGVSDWMNGGGYRSAEDLSNGMADTVGGIRQGQGNRINDQKNDQQGFTQNAYGRVRGNLGDWTNNTNSLAVRRNSDLSSSTNGAYNGMAARSEGVHGALSKENDATFAGAQNRLLGAMDLNGATQMRATAPLVASAKARMRAAGIDSNSPEGASLMARTDEARAHALDDSLANNIGQQNQLALGRAEVNRGLDLDSLNTSNSLAARQNELGRADTNQLYDASQGVNDTRLQMGNQADMGEYGDTRQNYAQQYQDQQRLDDTRAQDTYGQTQFRAGQQQQDFGNRVNLAQGQNGVNQQSMQYKAGAGQAGANWANANFGAQQQARNAMMGQYGTMQNNSLGWGNNALGANQQAMGGYQNIYGNESANSNWLGKGLIGMGTAAAGAFAGGAGAAAGKKWF